MISGPRRRGTLHTYRPPVSAAITSTNPGPCVVLWLSLVHSLHSIPTGLPTQPANVLPSRLSHVVSEFSYRSSYASNTWRPLLMGHGDRRPVFDLVTVNNGV